MSVRVESIRTADLRVVGEFLHEHMNRHISVASWVASVQVPWARDAPNHGFLLRDDERVVGVYTAIYSERRIAGKTERFCNFATWCVLPAHRRHSLSLLMKLLSQKDCHFTDLMPQGEVVDIMRRFDFRELDSRWVLMLNLPWGGERGAVVTDPEEIATCLTGEALHVFRDHQELDSLHHLVLRAEGRPCHVMFHLGRRRFFDPIRVPLLGRPLEARVPCATLLHLSAPELLQGRYATLGRHLLKAEGAILTIFEARQLLARPPLSFRLQSANHRLYRSPTLAPEQIDNLYSEAVTLAVPSDMA